jgi:hypothetical protein
VEKQRKEQFVHADYWIKWIVAEHKLQEGLDQARHQALVEMVSRESRDRARALWWRAVMLSVMGIGRRWLAAPTAMTESRDLVLNVPANEGFGAC